MATGAGEVQKRPATPVEVLKNIMNAPSVQDQFKATMKENSGSFMASIIDLYNGDSYLQKCEPKQVVMECLKAATLKLPINKQLGFAYIVPYGNSAQFQLGYKGYIQLSMRTGQYKRINSDQVLQGQFVSKNVLTGEIDLSGTQTSEIVVGYFAHFELMNGFTKSLYMSKEEVVKWAARYSKSYKNATSAWKTNFDEMAIKTCLRRLLSKYGIMSVEMQNAYLADKDDDPQTPMTDSEQPQGNTIDLSDYKVSSDSSSDVKPTEPEGDPF